MSLNVSWARRPWRLKSLKRLWSIAAEHAYVSKYRAACRGVAPGLTQPQICFFMNCGAYICALVLVNPVLGVYALAGDFSGPPITLFVYVHTFSHRSHRLGGKSTKRCTRRNTNNSGNVPDPIPLRPGITQPMWGTPVFFFKALHAFRRAR